MTSAAVRVPCLLCTKRDSVASLPIVGGFVVQCCQPCHQQSQANKAKFGNAAKHDFCSQCFYNKSKRTVLYRDQRIATLYTKLDNATQLIVDKEYDKARLRLQKLVQDCPGLFAAHYNLACIESLAGNAQESLAHLNQAFLMGYTNFANAAKDPDLANVRKLSSFKPLLKQFEKTPKQPSREVLGQVIAMCDVCAEVLASTSTEAEKKTTVKNLCEQCRHNKAVLKAQLPDGSMMKLCSECAQSISPQAAGAKSSSGEQPQQPPPPTTTPSGHTDNGPPPPPARPANRGPIGGGGDPPPPSDEEIDSRGASMRASGDQSAAAGASMSEIERIVAQEEAAAKEKSLFNQPEPPAPEAPPAQQPQQQQAAAASQAAPPGPKRLVGAVALMPGIVLPVRGGPGGLRRGPAGPGSPGDPAQRLVAQRGAPPPLSRGPGEQPPAAAPAPTPAAAAAPAPTPATTAAAASPQPAARQAPQPVARGAPAAPAAAAAAAAGAAASPLPAGWQEFTDKKTGRNYYYCAATKETVWVRPGPEKAVPGATAAAPSPATATTTTTTTTATASTTATTPAAAGASDALPAGWQEFTDKKTGRNYYYCAATKETVWVRPGPEKAVPGAATSPKPAVPAAAAAAPTAAAAAATTTTTTAATTTAPPAAAAAAGPLPAGWVEYMDKQRKLPYYYNAATKQTVWVRPTAESVSAAAATPTAAATGAAAAQVQIMPLDDDDDDDVVPPAAEDSGAAAPGQVEVLPLSDDE